MKDEFPTWRGQNEQSMALAAVGFAKAKRRRQIMVALSSIGPGAGNMITAAGCAMANRLPILILAGDVFANRRPDPVLQQVEHFNNPTTTVNDAFRRVSPLLGQDHASGADHLVAAAGGRHHARPGRLRTGLPRPLPGHAGARLRLSRRRSSSRASITSAARAPDRGEIARAAALLKKAKKPLVIAGGGVRYSLAEAALTEFAEKHRLPVAETIAGRA